MASRRMLADTVELYNYLGEIDDEATYQKTILRHCYCPTNQGVGRGNQGKIPNDTATLYIFDAGTVAEAEDGSRRSYIPYSEWEDLPDRSRYWTLDDSGDDFFRKSGSEEKFRIAGVSRRKAGTRRMWHFEVSAR